MDREQGQNYNRAIATLADEEQIIARTFAAHSDGGKLMARVLNCAPFLREALFVDPSFAGRLFAKPPQHWRQGIEDQLRSLACDAPRADIAVELRHLRRRHALGVALLDLANVWSLEEVTDTLSSFARLALQVALDTTLHEFQKAGRIRCKNFKQSGYTIILLGKGGAGELNYSSDVDFIVLYDPERISSTSRRSLQQEMNLLTTSLISLLSDGLPEGRVFRCDLRLRPDPAATPLAVPVNPAIAYYESRGQNWERCVMIKASFAAGDKGIAQLFLGEMQRYVWRRYLDFETIKDIHSIKRQIASRYEAPTLESLLGHNLKLGQGGIREIEFFVQTQQLIWGGRDSELRAPQTLAALSALAAAGRISGEGAHQLRDAYRRLREWEHRLQMIDDAQTHILPRTDSDFADFATFCAAVGPDTLGREIRFTLERVSWHYARLFEEESSLAGEGHLVFTGPEPSPDTLATLKRMGFRDGERTFNTIRHWQHGRLRATAAAKARERLTELVPLLLEKCVETQDPDQTLARFDYFLTHIPAGVQLFTLLRLNPTLFSHLVETFGLSSVLAEHLAHRPQILDSMLDGDFFAPPPRRLAWQKELRHEISEARDFEDGLFRLRRRVNDRRFQVGFQALHGLIEIHEAARSAARLAEGSLHTLLPMLARSFAEAHGRPPHGARGFACLALGRLGSGEMGFLSDLDLIFLFDERLAEGQSDGERPLATPLYWGRFARRIQSTLSANSSDGRIYEVDPRLRPHGAAGETAISLSAFSDYHKNQAWVWEKMALTRARVVYSDPEFRARIRGELDLIFAHPLDAKEVWQAARDMRARLTREHPSRGPLDFRYMEGGLYDIDLLAQAWMLAQNRSQMVAHASYSAFALLARAGLLEGSRAVFLRDTARLWEDLRWYLQITAGATIVPDEIGLALRAGLVRVAGAESFEALMREVGERGARVSDMWNSSY
ncbi:MAG: bifunctional [glutamine synthetase] adenylyltransferase/[glutamine synthetase]-adenylyl-L-tyrosine phosphorylase [Alphaproteobacteria bacterium]